MSGENVVNTVDDLVTDTSKLKKYATDNKLTLKEISDSINKQRYKKKLESDPMEQVNYIEDKQGMNAMDYIDEGARVGDFDPKGYSNYETKGMNLPEKKASGGIAGMLGE
jgi:ribosomal protein RSM22 (predicted rRNA methylase)